MYENIYGEKGVNISHEINNKLNLVDHIIQHTIQDKDYKTAIKALELFFEHSNLTEEKEYALNRIIDQAMEEKEYKIAIRALELFFSNFTGAKQIDLHTLENLPTHKLKELLAKGVM